MDLSSRTKWVKINSIDSFLLVFVLHNSIISLHHADLRYEKRLIIIYSSKFKAYVSEKYRNREKTNYCSIKNGKVVLLYGCNTEVFNELSTFLHLSCESLLSSLKASVQAFAL